MALFQPGSVPSLAPLISEGSRLITREWLRPIIDLFSTLKGNTQGATWQWGEGSPAGVVVANVGSVYLRTDGGAGTTLYVKESGSGSSAGWAGK